MWLRTQDDNYSADCIASGHISVYSDYDEEAKLILPRHLKVKEKPRKELGFHAIEARDVKPDD